jgi:hypothetical protein
MMTERERILAIIEARARRVEENVVLPVGVRVMIAKVLRNMAVEIDEEEPWRPLG